MADITDGIAPVADTPAEPTYLDDGEVTGQLIDNELPALGDEPMAVEDMRIPLRAEVEDESGKTDGDVASSADGGEPADGGADDKGAATTDAPEPAPTQVSAEPAPQLEVEDPGEFKPSDYSFEVTVGGKVQKVSSLEEANAIAEDPDNFTTPKELMDFLDKKADMRDGLRQEQREWQTKKNAYDEYVASNETREATLSTWESEINYLAQKGDLPALDPKAEFADWSDPEIAKLQGVKERVELLTYMQKENELRKTAGLPPSQSMVDMFKAMKGESIQTQAVAEKKVEAEVRKAKGSMVGGNTPSQPTRLPKDVIVGEGGTLDDLNNYAFF